MDVIKNKSQGRPCYSNKEVLKIQWLREHEVLSFFMGPCGFQSAAGDGKRGKWALLLTEIQANCSDAVFNTRLPVTPPQAASRGNGDHEQTAFMGQAWK